MSMFAILIQTVTAFNLVCTGMTHSSSNNPGESTGLIRVDLQSQRYCLDGCVKVLPIKRITESEIFFEDGQPNDDGYRVFRSFNRETFAYRAFADLGGFKTETTGACKVAPFSGFPSGATAP